MLALLTLAGLTVMDVMCGGRLSRGDRKAGRNRHAGTGLAGELEIERSITIGKPADELYRRWRDPKTLSEVMPFLATVRASGEGRTHRRTEGPPGRSLDWDTQTVDDRPGEGVGWRSLPGAALPNEASIRFRLATGGRGTVATLRVRFDPPGGALGEAAAKLLGSLVPGAIADKALERFKSLAETGEIPATKLPPACRPRPPALSP